MSRSSAGSLPGSPLARIRSMTSSRRPLRRAAPTWAAHTYAASRSRTALRMAIDRSLGSTTVVSRKNVTSESIRSASFGLWSSMLNGPRTPPNTFTTESTTAWCSVGTSDLPVIGATRGMVVSFQRLSEEWLGSTTADDDRARLVVRAQDALAAAPRAHLTVVPVVAVVDLHAVLLLQRGDLTVGEPNAVDDDVARLRVSHAGAQHDGENPEREDLHQITPRFARSAICSLV